MTISAEQEEQRSKIKKLILETNEKMCEALVEGNQGLVASCTYMIAEYESMLEEYCTYHNISKY